MKMKFCKLTFLLFCMWNPVQAAIKLINDDISDVIDSCDYTRFDNQLIKLQYGNDLLQHKMVIIEKDLDKQKDIFKDLERKINSLPQQIEAMQEKLLQNNRQNVEDLKDFIRKEIQIQTTIVPPVDDKIVLITGMRETLTKHDQMLDKIIKYQNDSKTLLNEIKLETHTQDLKNTIADKLAIMPQIDAKLSKIESNTIPKADHIKFYQDVHEYFNKINATKICLKDDNQTLTCTNQSYPTSCLDFDATHCSDNKCRIINHLYGPAPFFVACNNSVDDGGWIVIQRRINGSVDFYRSWAEYKAGFGDLNGELFIGLDKLHALTSTFKPMELLIQLQDFDNVMKYAKYDDFQIGNESEKYKLIKVGSYNGDAGDSLSLHVGYNFSTKDRDNDIGNENCAVYKTGAWWYEDCGWSNLNGKYYNDPSELKDAPLNKRGINWNDFHGYKYSLKFVQMLIRPKRL